MDGREPARCATLAAAEMTVAAFAQACREAGIGPHPGGGCPAGPCPCQDPGVAGWVALVAGRLGVPVPGIAP